MPSKKSSHHGDKEGKGGVRPSSPLFKEGGDPIETVISMVEKKARNLSKRKDRLTSLAKQGKALDKDQQDAISKLPDVLIQIDFLHEMLKQFSDLNIEYQKHLKVKLRAEEKKRKEEEKQIQKSSLRHCLRIQAILEQFDGATKDAFCAGSDGAVKLTDEEVKQIDEFYELVSPKRPGNSNFENDVLSAAQHMVLLQEKSNDKVVGTTYKSLSELFTKVDMCGYLDKEEEVPEEEEDEDEEDETYEDDNPSSMNEFTSSLKEVQSNILDDDEDEDLPQPSPNDTYQRQRDEILSEQIRQTTPTQQPLVGPSGGQTFTDDEPARQQSGHPMTAPSPDFAGLGSSPLISTSIDFQFMRGDPQPPPVQQQQQSSQPPPRFNSPTFPSTFKTMEHNSPIERIPSSNTDRPDGQYVPETGQQMSDKSDLVGNPVVGISDGSNDQPSQTTGNNMYKGANGHFMQQQHSSSYDNRRYQRNTGNNRQRPYGKQRRDGGYGGGNGGNSNGYMGGSSNRGMGGGNRQQQPSMRNGGRGRPNYAYSRQPQNRSSNGPRNNTRPPQHAATASAQS